MPKQELLIPWSEIENRLETLAPTQGGYSDAQRGIISLPDNRQVFVKVGINDHTKGWASKEIKVYAFLAEHLFSYMPEFLSKNADETAFAIEALVPEAGWDWSDAWDEARLDATLAALDALADIRPGEGYSELLEPVVNDKDNCWLKLAASPEQSACLRAKLTALGKATVADDIPALVQKSQDFQMCFDTLVHLDVRADNCPWNKTTQAVKLVDWNWLGFGDRRIDLAAMLTHVHVSGFNVLLKHSERLDAGALRWMAGFWLESTSKPIWPGGPERLRDIQLKAGITALDLAEQVESGLKQTNFL